MFRQLLSEIIRGYLEETKNDNNTNVHGVQ
jgi:hypothetical protein